MEGQTATNPQTGEKVVLRGGQWVPLDQAPQQPQRAPGFIPGAPKAPDPYRVEQDAQSNQRANTNTNLSIESGDRSQRGQVQDYRKEFDNSAPVKTYGVAITSLANAVKRGEDGSGDVALIYDYAKAMDPESVVRESEVGMAQAGQSMIKSAAARYKKEFGIEGGGVLDPQTRQYLRREIINAARSRRQAYEQQRERFSGIAQRNNFNVEDIIGPDLGAPFREDLSRFGVSGRRFTDAEMAARAGLREGGGQPPEGPNGSMRVPGATMDNIRFDIDGGGEPVEGKRLTPEQERDYQAFIAANRETLTPELLDAWWKSRGFGGLSNAEEVIAAAKAGSLGGVDYSKTDQQRRDELDAQLRAEGTGNDNFGDYATGGIAGLDRGITLGWSDELAGVAGGIHDIASGGSFSDGYTRERDLTRRAQEISREKVGIAPELAGGLMVPGSALGRVEGIGQFIRQGAGVGALAGAGEGQGASDSAINALLGAGGGAVVGAAASQAPRVVNALLDTQAGQRATGVVRNALERTRPNVDAEVVAAGQRQGIPIRLPDAVEGKRPAMAALEKTKTGAPRVASARAEDINATQDRLASLVPEGASARDETQLGKMLQSAMERQNEVSKSQTSAFFKRVEKMAPGARSDAADTLAYIDGEISRLQGAGSRGNASAIKALQDMRADIAETGLSVESLQSLRASIRQRVKDNNLDPSATDRLFGGVDEAATADLEKALGAVNKNAVGAFRRANRSHAERLAFRREVAKELTGTPNNPLDAEKAATRLMSKIGSKGDEEGFGRIWASLDDAERADTAATILHNYGGGDEFSLQKLATNLENANERTLRTVFGKDGYEALRDIRLIARRKTQTQKGLNNSNTGSVVEEKGNSLLDTILGVFGYTQGGPLGAAAAVGARSLGEKVGNSWRARLLLNPDFTKWLKQTPNTTRPEVINRYFERLNKIASREQAFLMDAQQLQSYLAAQFSKSPGRAAADDETGNRGRVEPR